MPAVWLTSWTIFVAPAVWSADLEFAHSLYRDRRYQLAAEEYRAVLKDLPGVEKSAEATFYLAECLVQLGERREAVSHYETLARDRAGKHRPTALFRLGVLHARLEKPRAAAEALRRFLDEHASDPKAATAWCLLVENLTAADDAPAAQSAAATAESVIDKNHTLRTRLRMAQAKAAEKAGANREAERLYAELAASAAASAADAAFAQARLLYGRKAYLEATESFDRAASKSQDATFVAQAKYNAALALLEAEKWSDAERRLVELLRTPELPAELSAEAPRQLIVAYLRQKDFARARKVAKEWETQIGPWSAVMRARVEFEAGEHGAALAAINRDLSRLAGPPREEGLTLAARIAAALGDADAAVLALTELRRGFPKSAKLEAVEAELANAASWKSPNDAHAKLGAALRTEAARLQLSYSEAVRLFRERRDAEVEALLLALRGKKLPEGMRGNVDYLLGVALGRQKKWRESAASLLAYFANARSATGGAHHSAGVALGRAFAHEPDVAKDHLGAILSDKRATRDRAEYLSALADGLIEERAHARAFEILEALERIGLPDFKGAGRCLLELNRPREALAKLPENPTDPEESYLRGVALVAVGENAAGKEALQSVASATPASPWSLDAALRLARTAGNRVERQAAETLLEKLEPSADPTQRSAVRIELAMLAADLGRPLEAASELQALAESGDRGDALAAGLKLAEIFEQRGDYLQAERWLSRAEKAGVPPTGRPALAYRKASLAFRAKNWERVETLLAPFEETFANDPLAAAAQLLRAESALERGRAAEAVERFRKLDKLPGGEAFRATAHLRTSQALLLDKKWREAFAEAERYLATPAGKERPAEAWFVQGRTLQQQAQFAEARKSFERCAASGDAELQTRARFMIGESYFHQRRHRDALKEYLRAALLGGAPSWQAAALLQVGQCHEALGETVAARDTYAKAIERFPNEPATIEVRKRLAALPPDRAN